MYVIDSSGWIEHFTDGPNATRYRRYLRDLSKIITPTIVLYEVYKKIKRERSEEEALQAVALMQQTTIAGLDDSAALSAADISLKHTIPMADSIVYATALDFKCRVITSDMHFDGLEEVEYIAKLPSS